MSLGSHMGPQSKLAFEEKGVARVFAKQVHITFTTPGCTVYCLRHDGKHWLAWRGAAHGRAPARGLCASCTLHMRVTLTVYASYTHVPCARVLVRPNAYIRDHRSHCRPETQRYTAGNRLIIISDSESLSQHGQQPTRHARRDIQSVWRCCCARGGSLNLVLARL